MRWRGGLALVAVPVPSRWATRHLSPWGDLRCLNCLHWLGSDVAIPITCLRM